MTDTSPALASISVSKPLTVSDYSALVATLPTPTPAQMEAFAAHVCGAHSWYKHLPFYPPGKPMQFFLDPAAGMDLTFQADHVDASPRVEQGFHYSSIPTQQYRERFGHLAFSRSSGTTVFRTAGNGALLAPSDDAPGVYDATARSLRRLPAEVVHAGVAWISGLVHPDSATPPTVLKFAAPKAPSGWPQESGGQLALAEILEYCKSRQREDTTFGAAWFAMEDERLAQMLAPERARQRAGMISAMRRVIELVWAARSG